MLTECTRVARTPRLVHGKDMNPAAAFVVDPDTQHLYHAYGRGNIPQLERQKLMTGTYIHVRVDTRIQTSHGCSCTESLRKQEVFPQDSTLCAVSFRRAGGKPDVVFSDCEGL